MSKSLDRKEYGDLRIRKKGNVGREYRRRANRYEPDHPVSNSTLRNWGFNPSAGGLHLPLFIT